MIVYTAQQLVSKLESDMEVGWLLPDDVVAVEFWAYDDVLDFTYGDDYYGKVTNDLARKVWAGVVRELSRYDSIDNDMVRDEISAHFDKRMGKA